MLDSAKAYTSCIHLAGDELHCHRNMLVMAALPGERGIANSSEARRKSGGLTNADGAYT
jgi:hypothetical protein